MQQEAVMPFPRITFGYFFDHPFWVTNHTDGETVKAEMVISRISTRQISVRPASDRVKILGAHVKPYTLAMLTRQNISELPWLIPTELLFGRQARDFKKRVDRCEEPGQMFAEVEKIFLKTLLQRDLSALIKAVETVEAQSGAITIARLAQEVGVSTRTLRNYFYKYIGCAPKEYLHLVKLKQAIYQMKNSADTLTGVGYDQQYADQAHFTNTVKNITGSSPKKIKEQLPDFRFLQF